MSRGVLHVIAPGPIAGAEKVVLGGTAAQVARGLDVTVAVLGDSRCPEHGQTFADAAKAGGADVALITTRGRVDPRAAWRLARLRRSRSWLAAHTHGYKALTYTTVSARPGSPPIVAHHHGTTEHDRRVRVYERLALLLCRAPGVRSVMVPGQAMAARLAGGGVPLEMITVVDNFVSLPAVPARVGHEPPPRALVLGRVSVEKGLDVLLAALDSSPGLEVEVSVVGDGPERERLEVASRGDTRVRWVGYATDVRPHLAATDLLLLPSRREGLPMTVLEAAACGLPIIASDVGSVREIVTDGDNGRLVRPDDPAALAAALAETLAHLARYQATAAARADAIRHRFSADRWAEETERIYRRLTPTSREAR